MEQPDYNAAPLSLNKRRELPLVWILPIIAFLVSVWLVAKSIHEKGPVITIRFPTAEGLEVDKTKIRFLNVEIGKVTAITIDQDLKTILVTAQINHSAEDYLHEHTQFWVVRPQIGLGGVSGLGTLLSGAYIEIQPGDGDDQSNFTGLSNPPVLKHNQDGRYFVLETDDLGSLRPGTPIHFHGINVGEVLNYKLVAEGGLIQLSAFINAPYHRFVRKNTHFWKDGGIDVSAGAEGFKVRTAPLVSLLSGGIAFEASQEDNADSIMPDNTAFELFNSYEQTTQITYQNSLKYVMYFSGSVRGLAEGAPVQLRGITIGKVKKINVEVDEHSTAIRIPVLIELELDRIKGIHGDFHGDFKISDHELVTALVKKGLRAQLQTGSLLTGQLLVDLDFYPESKPREILTIGKYPEFPTTASSLDQFSTSAKVIMDKLSKLPLNELTAELNKTLQSLQTTSAAATTMLHSAKSTLTTADHTINKAGRTLTSADQTLSAAQQTLSTLKPGSDMQYQLHQMLLELTQAASSVRQMADILEQHPDSVIRGKQQP
ncbi:MAG: MlaD family protein [Methylococcales bacterium]